MIMKISLKHNFVSLFAAISLLTLSHGGCQQKPPRVYKVASSSNRGYHSEGPNVGQIRNHSNYRTQTPPLPTEMAADGYHIGPADVLEIRIYQLLELEKQEVLLPTVDRRGQIYLPLVNHVQAAGLTCEQLRRELIVRLGREFIRDPKVDVGIKEYASKEVLVLGAVGRPGRLALQTDRTTLLNLIGQAGGISSEAAPDIEILRGAYQSDQAHNDRMLTNTSWSDDSLQAGWNRVVVPVVRLFAETGEQINPFIYPGDVVKVPHRTEGFVYIAGEVKQPGAKEFRRPLNILQAVTCAGGTTKIAQENKCKIVRLTPEGAEKIIVVDLSKIQKGKQPNLLLAQNDTIFIPFNPTKKFFDDLDNMIRRGINAGVDVTYDAGYDMGLPTRGTVMR